MIEASDDATTRNPQQIGALPDFMIIGAQKAGTTSLFRYLIQHPQIVCPLWKEIHYFDVRFHRPVEWYRAFFPVLAADVEPANLDKRAITGEATPSYRYHPRFQCARRA